MKKIINQVYWTGINDWELRQFHGYEYSTHRGSTYNSYLVKEKKIALIDTVFIPFSSEFIKNLSKEIELSKIDYIIANHAEPGQWKGTDIHPGSYAALARQHVLLPDR
jgi:anaerobic nitric oxide reductase flavorubredoxin